MIFIYSSYSKFTNWPDMSHLAVFPPVQDLSDSAPDSYLDIAFNYHDFKRFSRLSLLFTVPRFLKSAGQYFVKFPSIWFCFMFSYDQAYFFFFFGKGMNTAYGIFCPHTSHEKKHDIT